MGGMNGIGEVIALDIDFIECSGHTSCEGMTFVTGVNVNIASVKCAFGACAGCLIKETLADAGVPCDPSQTTAAPGGVVGPVVELPIGSISLPGPATSTTLSPPLNIVLPGMPATPSTTAKVVTSPPLNIVLPPLPGMPATPSTTATVPATTAKTITLPIPTQPTQTVPATTAKVVTLPTIGLPPPPQPPVTPVSTVASSTTTTTTTMAPVTTASTTSKIAPVPVNPGNGGVVDPRYIPI